MSNSKRIFPAFICLSFASLLLLNGEAVAQHLPTASGVAKKGSTGDLGQAPLGIQYGFKGFHLGMSLEDFKKATSGDTAEVAGPATHGLFANSYWARKKAAPHKVATPFCTDTMTEADVGAILMPSLPGVIVCNPSPQNANPKLLEAAGIGLVQAVYYFYNDKLYQIVIKVLPRDFDALVSAFRERYGPADEMEPTKFQNALGATWAGRNFLWQRGSQAISFSEGMGNGPGQLGGANPSVAAMVDFSLKPSMPDRHPVDF